MDLDEFVDDYVGFQFNTTLESLKNVFPKENIDELFCSLKKCNLDDIAGREFAKDYIKNWYWTCHDVINKRRKRG